MNTAEIELAITEAVLSHGWERAQTSMKLGELNTGQGRRRLVARDLLPCLTSKQRSVMLAVASGHGIGARMHNTLYHAGLIEYRLGGRSRYGVRLTAYGAAVVRELGGCPHDAPVDGPTCSKIYKYGGKVEYRTEICLDCGARRRTCADLAADFDAWWMPEQWSEYMRDAVEHVDNVSDTT